MCWYELYKFLSNPYIHVRVVLLCERQSPEWWRYCIEYVHRTDKLRDETSILKTEMKHSVKNHICYSKCHAQHSTKESLLRQHVHVSDWWHTPLGQPFSWRRSRRASRLVTVEITRIRMKRCIDDYFFEQLTQLNEILLFYRDVYWWHFLDIVQFTLCQGNTM